MCEGGGRVGHSCCGTSLPSPAPRKCLGWLGERPFLPPASNPLPPPPFRSESGVAEGPSSSSPPPPASSDAAERVPTSLLSAAQPLLRRACLWQASSSLLCVLISAPGSLLNSSPPNLAARGTFISWCLLFSIHSRPLFTPK